MNDEQRELFRAIDAFIEALIPRADAEGPGRAPLWYGWAVRDAFRAGIAWQKARQARETAGRPGKETP